MELGAAAADPVPSTTRTVLNSTVNTGAAAADEEDPPF
jgi:hypothetical protein